MVRRGRRHHVSQSCNAVKHIDDNNVFESFTCTDLGTKRSHKNCISHIDASLSRQPLVKGERLVRHEVNAVIHVPGGLGLFL